MPILSFQMVWLLAFSIFIFWLTWLCRERGYISAYYDPRVYYNFNGPLYFQLEFALAPQLNISGHNKVLIPPWKLYNALHPGTLIMAVVQISTCGFPEGSRIQKATLSFPAS
jgi:hypothetical protein